ncbi:hypothetical protein WN943_026109 [Citrus x changshan-huyou]
MHANLRPHVTKILSHATNDPNPSPLRHTPSDPVEFTLNLTTLDPIKHIVVILPTKNHATAGQSPSEKTAANPKQHLLLKQLAEPPDGKDEKDGNIMANYEGDSQPVFGHDGEDIMSDGEDIMSDDENTVVNETPGVHEGMTVGLSA